MGYYDLSGDNSTIVEDISVRSGAYLIQTVANNRNRVGDILGLAQPIYQKDNIAHFQRMYVDDFHQASLKNGKIGELEPIPTVGYSVEVDDFRWDYTKFGVAISVEAVKKIKAGENISLATMDQAVNDQYMERFIEELLLKIGYSIGQTKVRTYNKADKDKWKNVYDSTYKIAFGDDDETNKKQIREAFKKILTYGNAELHKRSKRGISYGSMSGIDLGINNNKKTLALMPMKMLPILMEAHIAGIEPGMVNYYNNMFAYVNGVAGVTCVFLYEEDFKIITSKVENDDIYKAKKNENPDITSNTWVLLMDSDCIRTLYQNCGEGMSWPTAQGERAGLPTLITSYLANDPTRGAMMRYFWYSIGVYIKDPTSIIFYDLGEYPEKK